MADVKEFVPSARLHPTSGIPHQRSDCRAERSARLSERKRKTGRVEEGDGGDGLGWRLADPLVALKMVFDSPLH